MEESYDFNFLIQFIQLERSQVRVQLVTGLFFPSMIDQGWFLIVGKQLIPRDTNARDP